MYAEQNKADLKVMRLRLGAIKWDSMRVISGVLERRSC